MKSEKESEKWASYRRAIFRNLKNFYKKKIYREDSYEREREVLNSLDIEKSQYAEFLISLYSNWKSDLENTFTKNTPSELIVMHNCMMKYSRKSKQNFFKNHMLSLLFILGLSYTIDSIN